MSMMVVSPSVVGSSRSSPSSALAVIRYHGLAWRATGRCQQAGRGAVVHAVSFRPAPQRGAVGSRVVPVGVGTLAGVLVGELAVRAEGHVASPRQRGRGLPVALGRL